jgi:hypothetical protein
MNKTCTKCKTVYGEPLSDHFNKKLSALDGYQYHCKSCIRDFHIQHYLDRKNYYKEKAVKHNDIYKLRSLQFMIDYLKEHPCVDCGETDPIVLEFDHLGNKDYAVSEMRCASLEKISKEIAKCEIRCCNCHRKKTAKQLGWYKDITF